MHFKIRNFLLTADLHIFLRDTSFTSFQTYIEDILQYNMILPNMLYIVKNYFYHFSYMTYTILGYC